jgi:hypothetical protein
MYESAVHTLAFNTLVCIIFNVDPHNLIHLHPTPTHTCAHTWMNTIFSSVPSILTRFPLIFTSRSHSTYNQCWQHINEQGLGYFLCRKWPWLTVEWYFRGSGCGSQQTEDTVGCRYMKREPLVELFYEYLL